ncbi:phosphoethanolamine transferase EptA [Photobacterium jeanii]|uniref:Phosphoethanolamine transferase EptA n=1 Tax=Photobacterium jeanii TaxID=858640 RepID=A0A178K1Q0_9GAMM|nr:phosphoethanolamine transferase EptA [Photobacterium jeanii]OAN11259.1 phosphoethanolamine transferase EptA [Photobacterium jeanii]PST90779.1 phosphoethanolamine transferase EptA [Photobacterium jeanii]
MKIRLNSILYTLLIALFFTIFQNIALWERLDVIFDSLPDATLGFKLSLPFFILAIMNVVFTLFTWPYLHRAIIGLIVLISAAATFGMHQYGVVLDYDMIVNVIETDTNEATSYMSMSVILWFTALAIIPLIVMSRVQVNFNGWIKEVLFKLLSIVGSVAVVAIIASLYYKDYASLIRNNTEIKSMLNPTNYITATFRVAKNRLYEANLPFVQIGTDAVNGNEGNERKNVLVVVVGETARAMNSSFNGYEKDTNEYLAKQEGVINYPNVSSCGTSTAISVPCMFSNMTKSEYNASTARRQEGVLDIIKHAGIDVLWKNNNSGCKGACDRVAYIDARSTQDEEMCRWGTCFDGVLLNGLDEHISSLENDGVIVLHLLGSHGPTYFKRYPDEFKKFTPTCDTAEIQKCNEEELINTYDNTLLYTDFLLSEVIDVLKAKEDKFNTAMLYVSDHGESLGENGVYLHGLPYAIAPDTQTHVPMVTWMSDSFTQKHNLDTECLKKAAQGEYSQDNFFHSLLGLMDVSTSEYKSELDMFATCANNAS